MNNPQLSNTNPPEIIDFLAGEDLQSPQQNCTSERLAAFVEDARQRLVGLPYAEKLKEVKSFILKLRRMKPADLDVWWERTRGRQHYTIVARNTHYPLECDPPAPLPFTGFTGIATIKSIRVEGYDAPECEQIDGLTHHERRAAKDNLMIGGNEEAEVTPDE